MISEFYSPTIVSVVVQPTRETEPNNFEACPIEQAEVFSFYFRDRDGVLHWQADFLNLDFAAETARYWAGRVGIPVETPLMPEGEL